AEGAEERHLRELEHLEPEGEGDGDHDRGPDRVLQREAAGVGDRQLHPANILPLSMADETTQSNGGRTAWARNLATPVRDFLGTETGSALVLVGAVIAALAWAK